MQKKKELTTYEKISRERINYLISTYCGGSQQRFVEKTGLNKGSVSQYVNGRNSPSNITAGRIAEVFKINPAWIMGFDVPMILNDPAASDQPAAPVSPSVAPVQLRQDESELLDKYNLLNAEGMKEIHNHADYIASQDRFLKDTSENIREVG